MTPEFKPFEPLLSAVGCARSSILNSQAILLLTEWEGQTAKYLARGHGVRGPCTMTESQIFSRPARPNSVNKYVIIAPFSCLILSLRHVAHKAPSCLIFLENFQKIACKYSVNVKVRAR